MLDVVSVVLSFISVIQNLKNRRTAEEKLQGISDSIEKVDLFYKLLRDAKQIHDQFDKLLKAGMEPLHKLIMQENAYARVTAHHIELFFEYYRMMIDTMVPLVPISTDQARLQNLPVEIRTCIEKLGIVYPQLRDAITTFEQNKAHLVDLHKKKNYGEDLRTCVILLNNAAKEIQSNADKTIMNVAPVIDFIHFTLRNGIKEL